MDQQQPATPINETFEAEVKFPYHTKDGNGFLAVATLGLTRIYGISEEGAVSVESKPFDIDRLFFNKVPTSISQEPVLYSLNSRNSGKKFTLTPGAACLLGRPYSGKSLFSNTLKKRNPDGVVLIRYREPEWDSIMLERDLIKRLNAALLSSATLIIVDSLRTTFYASGGTTGKGGVNMGIFALLTAYDLIAKFHGKVIMFTLNPMTNDEEAIQFYLEAAKGSVAHTLYATEPLKFTMSTRAGNSRDDFRMAYEPVGTDEAAAVTNDTPVVKMHENDESIASLYVTQTR